MSIKGKEIKVMGKAQRVRGQKRFLEARPKELVQERLKELRAQKVKTETRAQYLRELAKQKEFLEARAMAKMDAELFGDFIVWLHQVTVEGLPMPPEVQLKPLYDAIAGMRYRAGQCPGLKRGAMDSGQLAQLRYHCAVNGHFMEADAFAAIWYGMVRHGAAEKSSVHDIRLYAAKGPLWHLPMKKALRATRMKVENMSHFKRVHNLRSLFKTLTKGKRPEERLFPGWPQSRARALIREASIVFGWDSTVDWDGPHTMRNGASQEAKACVTDKVGSIMKRAVWSACCTAARYRSLRGVKAVRGSKKLSRG